MSQELDKPKFAFLGLSRFAFLVCFCFHAGIPHHYQYFSALWRILRSSGFLFGLVFCFCFGFFFFFCFFWAPGISQRRRSRGLVFILFLLHIPGTKHCAESAPIVATDWQQNGRRWESPGILPGWLEKRGLHTFVSRTEGVKRLGASLLLGCNDLMLTALSSCPTSSNAI